MNLPLKACIFVLWMMLPRLCLSEEFTVGVERINYFPYYYTSVSTSVTTTDPNAEYLGFARELLDSFAREHGYTFYYEPLPIKRLYRMLVEDKIDFKFPDHPTWGRKEKKGGKILYSKGVVGYIDGVLVLPENREMTIGEFKTISYVRGFAPPILAGLIDSQSITVNQINNWESLFHTILDGRVHGGYYNIDVAMHILSKELGRPEGLVFAPNLPYVKGNYRLSTKNYPEIMAQFDEFIVSPQASEIRDKFELTLIEH